MHVLLYSSIGSLLKALLEIFKIQKDSDGQLGIIGVVILFLLSTIFFVLFFYTRKKVNRQKKQSIYY